MTKIKYLGISAVFILVIAGFFFTNCGQQAKPRDASSESILRYPTLSITKDQGINIGESEAIWGVGIKATSSDGLSQNLIVHRIVLDPLKSYPKSSWTLKVKSPAISGMGSRTFVSEWGLLVARTGAENVNCGGQTCAVGVAELNLVDPITGPVSNNPLLVVSGNVNQSRAASIAYKVTRNGIDYKFAGLVTFKCPTCAPGTMTGGQPVMHVDRLLRMPNGSFQRMVPIVVPSSRFQSVAAVYKGFLDACSTTMFGECAPKFYGGDGGAGAGVTGIDLTLDVPPTPYNPSNPNLVITGTEIFPPNDNWVSTSHPAAGGVYGSINGGVYSFAGNTETGNVFKSLDPADFNSFTSFDRVNNLVYRVSRQSRLMPNGSSDCAPPGQAPVPCPLHSLVTVFDSACFGEGNSPIANCDPLSTPYSRMFTDVGESLGPTSDLGNGCVAILGFKRPGEVDGINYVAGVYKACVRDRSNLDHGLSVVKIGTFEGATYMYNDFTAATLYNRPLNLLFDFTKEDVSSIGSAKFTWSPKLGFSTTAQGLNLQVRCYAKGQTPPPFASISFDNAFIPADIPGCGGSGINQVEFEVRSIPGQRATRFQNFTVTATRM